MIPDQFLDSEQEAAPEIEVVRYKTGWVFPVSEEKRMMRACKNAARFMETFGKGRDPYMIDLSHYENSKTKQDGKKHK